MYGLLIANTVLLGAVLLVLVVGIVICARRITRALREVESALTEIRREIVPLAQDIRRTIANFDGLIASTRATVESVGRTTGAIERIVDGRTIADAASRVAGASRSTLAVLLEAAREAVRAFKTTKAERKETTEQSHKTNE